MKKLFILLALPLAFCFAACGDDDDKDSPKEQIENDENDDNNQEPEKEDDSYPLNVTIDENGNASNGGLFGAIDDENFYLDYIKYTVLDGHLVVSDYDKAYFKGAAKIVATITYKGKTYEVKEIGKYDYDYEAFRDCQKLTSVTIPNTVTSIGGYAFYNCSELTSVTLPNSVTTIGDEAFFYCPALTSITIPKSVTSMGEVPFGSCSALTSIKVESGNPKYDSRNNCNAIIETETNILTTGCQNTTIPNSVTILGFYAFVYCTGLTSITIPNSVTAIEAGTFYACEALTSITLPESLTRIGYVAFRECKSLTDITIPKSVTRIEAEAFADCTKLEKVHFKGKTPPICPSHEDLSYIFKKTGPNGYPTVYVPLGASAKYRAAFNNKVKVFEEN